MGHWYGSSEGNTLADTFWRGEALTSDHRGVLAHYSVTSVRSRGYANKGKQRADVIK